MLGLLIGFVVAALFVAGATVFDVAFEGSSATSLTVPAIVSGAIGGWAMAPHAVMPRDRRGWLGIVLALGALGVVVGDVTTVAIFLLAQPFGAPAWTGSSTIVAGTLAELAAASWLAIVGAVLYGWLALMVTVPAAAIWAAAMRLVTPRSGLPARDGSSLPAARA